MTRFAVYVCPRDMQAMWLPFPPENPVRPVRGVIPGGMT